MKKAVLSMMGLAAVAAGAQAQDIVGNVVSAVPVVQQVLVPRQVCSHQQVVQPQPSGGGALVGAVVGGLLGNTIGHGFGRAAATGVGMVAGAAVGNSIEGGGHGPQAVQHCTTQNTYENRTVGYNVTYEYAGRQHSVQLPYDPGPTVRLQVTPVGSGPAAMPNVHPGGLVSAPPIVSAPVDGAAVVQSAPVVVSSSYVYPASTVVVPAYPAYPAYYPRYYAPPVSFSIGLGHWGGYRHRHYRHWR
jgi:uncharacterized protein YcfJ